MPKITQHAVERLLERHPHVDPRRVWDSLASRQMEWIRELGRGRSLCRVRVDGRRIEFVLEHKKDSVVTFLG